jgi:FkbM family methyltransferase
MTATDLLPNGVMVVRGDTHHAVWCMTEGLVHDSFTAQMIRDTITRRNIKVACDIGANIGTLTRAMLDVCPMVHAFEPYKPAVECLRHNCPGAIIHHVALSDSGGMAIINPQSNVSASFIERYDGRDSLDNIVALASLDTYRLEPGFIKIDVEGCEVAVLRGGAGTIRTHKPIMLIEVNQLALERNGESEQTLLRELAIMNYQFTIIQPESKFGDPQFDIIATALT